MITDKELKELHEVQIEILKDVRDFCDKHKITYFLIAGTLLGSIRHSGFIPWDDDIDIGMMRTDYDKFIKLYPSNNKEKYYVQALETDPNYWQPYAKVRKSNTLMVEKRVENLNINKEIFIDIFPFDKAPDEGYEKIKYEANLIKVIRDAIYLKRKIKPLKECNFKLLVTFLRIFSVKFLYNVQKKLMMKYNKQETKYTVCYLDEYPTRDGYLKTSVFLPVKKGPFENLEVNILNKSDEYLKSIYGNYMELPPVEKRITHGIVKLKTKEDEE